MQNNQDSMLESQSNSVAPLPALPEQPPTMMIIGRIALSTVTLLVAAVCYYFLYPLLGIGQVALPTELDRLLYALRLEIYAIAPMVLTLKYVAFCRLTSPAWNPLSGNEAHVAKARNILANTTEQLLLHFFNLIIFSTLISEAWTFVIPGVVGAFVFGRITFTIGYLIHPKHRVYGFVWTWYSTVGLFASNVVMVTMRCLQ